MLAAADALDDCEEEAVTSVLLSLAPLVAMLLNIFRLTPEVAVVIDTSLDGLAEGTVVLAVYDLLLEGSGACAPKVAGCVVLVWCDTPAEAGVLAAADALDDCEEEAVTSVLLSLAPLVAMLLNIFRLTPEVAVVIGTSLDGLAEGTVVLAVYDVLLEGSGGACAPKVAVVVGASLDEEEEGALVFSVCDVLPEDSGGACSPEVAVVVDVSFELAVGTKDGPAEGAAVGSKSTGMFLCILCHPSFRNPSSSHSFRCSTKSFTL